MSKLTPYYLKKQIEITDELYEKMIRPIDYGLERVDIFIDDSIIWQDELIKELINKGTII